MTISEAQLETWSHQGAVQQSAATYNTIKEVLQKPGTNFAGKIEVFLQGSYGNDTNIYADSDVDIVLRYTDAFYKDISSLPADQLAAYNAAGFGMHPYAFKALRADVEAALRLAYPDAIKPSNKAIKIAAGGGRRNADVVPSFEYHRYLSFKSLGDEVHVDGIIFWAQDGIEVVNYPKLHSANLTAKHQATNGRFKPVVRIYKNIRNAMADAGVFDKSCAPSYFIEGLVYNVPNANFAGSLQEAIRGTLGWLWTADNRSKWLCANEQYYLLHDKSPVCWKPADAGDFLDAAVNFWNSWTTNRLKLI